MQISVSCLLSMLLAGALPGCHRREPAAFVPSTAAADPESKRDDACPATFHTEQTWIVEVEPADAEAQLTVQIFFPQLGKSDEIFYLKKVVTRRTFTRNADGSYSGSSIAMPAKKAHLFRACGGVGGYGGSSMVSSSSPDRVTVSIHRSWDLTGGVKGEAHGEIEVPWMGTSQKVFHDGATFHATFSPVDDLKGGSADGPAVGTEPGVGADSR